MEGEDKTYLRTLTVFAFVLPFLIVGPLFGMLADRLPRRGLMIAADFLRLGLMVGFLTVTDLLHPMGSFGVLTPLLVGGLFAALDGVDFQSDNVRYIFDTGVGPAFDRMSLYKDGRGFLRYRVHDSNGRVKMLSQGQHPRLGGRGDAPGGGGLENRHRRAARRG